MRTSSENERERNDHSCAKDESELVSGPPEWCSLHLGLDGLDLGVNSFAKNCPLFRDLLRDLLELFAFAQFTLSALEFNHLLKSALNHFVLRDHSDVANQLVVKVEVIERFVL